MKEDGTKYVYLKVRVDEYLNNAFTKIIKINKDTKQEVVNELIKSYVIKNFNKLKIKKQYEFISYYLFSTT